MQLRKPPRKKSHLYIGLGFLVALLVLINITAPTSLVTYILFFLLIFAALFFLSLFWLRQRRLALLLSCGITLFLILRALDLRHWLYPLLITAILVTVELYFRRR